MEYSFNNKDEKHYSSLSEINKLKRDLIPENFVTIENKNNSMNLNKNYYDINELDKEEENNKIINIKNEEEKIDNSIEQKNSKDDNIIHYLINEKIINQEEQEHKEKENDEENKENINNVNNIEKEKYEFKNTIEEELEKVKEKKIQDLIPLWYKCKNKDHGNKYITLDRQKKNLICKNCYTSGALETNLELNQEFIDNYIKEQELKNIMEQAPKDVIKETPEENLSSDIEENKNKSKSKSNLSEENKSEKSKKSSFYIKCLTFQCENYPYYYCEPCDDFICYHCIMQRMDEYTDKSRHYYHNIESVNYESNSFKDDIKLELDNIITKITISLDYLIKNEKIKNENFFKKIKKEKQSEIFKYLNNINKNINVLILQDKKNIYDKYIEKNFNNKDNVIKDLELSSNNTKSKIKKHLEELKIIKELMNKKDTTLDEICFIHQQYLDLIKNTNILMQKGNNIISQTTEELNYLNNEKAKKNFDEDEILQQQILSEKEKSFIQSLSNNSKKKGSYKLNRYVNYRHDGLKHFSFTSVELICHSDTILYGLFLCGKYLSSKKINQLDFSTIPLEQRGFYNINIKILEKDKKEPIFDENQKLYEIIDINNPIVDIIFGKGIKLEKEIKYIIIVENLENEKYCDIWVGKVYKKLISGNKQSIRCNNTGNIFDFYMPQEHNSDFNEFEQGIIEGILYGY